MDATTEAIEQAAAALEHVGTRISALEEAVNEKQDDVDLQAFLYMELDGVKAHLSSIGASLTQLASQH